MHISILAGSTVPVCVVEPEGDSDLRWNFLELRDRELVRRRKFEMPNDLGIERDDHDQYSTYLLVLASDKQVLAGCRLIDGGLTQITIRPELIVPGKHCELSRLLICSTVKDSQEISVYLCSLYARLLRYAFEERGYDDVYLDARVSLLRKLQLLFGEALERIGEPTVHVKHERRLKLVPTRVSSRSKDAMWASLIRRAHLHASWERSVLMSESQAIQVA